MSFLMWWGAIGAVTSILTWIFYREKLWTRVSEGYEPRELVEPIAYLIAMTFGPILILSIIYDVIIWLYKKWIS